MPYNGTGTFVRVYSWQTDKINGIKIRADRMDGEDDGFATGLSTVICKDGQTTPTANIGFGGFQINSIAAAQLRTDGVRGSQLQDNELTYFVASGTNAYVLTPSPAVTSYTAGQSWIVKFTNANTNAATTTIAVSGLAAKNITKDGATAVIADDIRAAAVYRITYDGTQFQLSDNSRTVDPYAVATGTDTYAATVTNAPTAYYAGYRVLINFTNANTTAATININSIGAASIKKNGATALISGDIAATMIAELVHDGTNFQMIPAKSPAPLNLSDGGLKTAAFTAASNSRYRMKGTVSAIVATLPGTASAPGDLLILTAYGNFGGLMCGTVNGIAQTLQFDQQSLLMTYTATTGWV